ncbi:cytochrome c [Methylomicrobium lacus]|uniref:cytochrome c n=1 Tax=Methylomicrobium lacus TaxID=136992 RepID=UPI00045E59CF|nr:cytochrome c [Methylomicrobium lacus]
MRNTMIFFAVAFALFSGTVSAESDFDFEELMNDVETKTQNVQNNIAAKDFATAGKEAKELQEAFKLVEGYFADRGDAADAVANAQDYQKKAEAIQSALSAGDADTAGNVAADFSKQCRGACHDKYKPL